MVAPWIKRRRIRLLKQAEAETVSTKTATKDLAPPSVAPGPAGLSMDEAITTKPAKKATTKKSNTARKSRKATTPKEA
jgi:hypothetical protein